TNQFPGSNYASFAQAFVNASLTRRPPHFLDFTGNGRVDARDDVVAAAGVITNLVKRYFQPWAPLNVQVLSVDVLRQTNRGALELQAGVHNRQLQTFVMYVGGARSDASAFGESYQGAVGFNNEDFGRTYTGTIVQYFAALKPNARPPQFARFVASTIAHELGH